MKYFSMVCMALLCVVSLVLGCAQQQTRSSQTKPTVSPSKSAKMVRVIFLPPVIMVNDKRAKKTEGEYTEKIEVSYPENSVHPITLGVIADGEEKIIHGQIEVFQAPQGESEILVAPKNPEPVYADIVRDGYGIFTVRQGIRTAKSEELGAIVAKLTLGTKKKIEPNLIEFRFKQGSVSSVNGKDSATELIYPENSRQEFQVTIDDGTIPLVADLEIYGRTPYTQFAPVWITLDETSKEYLRVKGGAAEIAISTSPKVPQSASEYVKVLDSEIGKDPCKIAQQEGNQIIARLKLRRAKE